MEIEKYSPKWLLEKINNSKNDAHKLMHIIEYSKEIIKSTDQQLILSGVSIALPSRKDYDERKLKPMYFKKTTSVGNSVLFTKGEQWQPYNWNYDRTIEYLKGGRLGYEC